MFLQDRQSNDLIPITSTLGIMEARLGLARADALAVLESRWNELLGDDLSSVCELLSLRDGVMSIAVDDPAVADGLRWMTGDLIAASNDICGGSFVSDVKITVKRRGVN